MATPPQLPPGVQALRYASMDTFFRRVVYFPSGSLDYAQRQLITDIYQTFFNRGLPRLAPAKKHPEWKYGYACLMAYDASPKGTLAAAWTALPLQTRRSFWEGANLYVMVLRGSST